MNSKIDDIYKFLESAGDNHVSAKKVLEYLDVLQLRQFGQKHHDQFSELLEGFSSIKDIQSFSDFLSGFLYSVIGQQDAITVISLCNNENTEFHTVSMAGGPDLLGKVGQMTESGQLKLAMKNSLDDLAPMFENRLLKIESLYHFVHKTIPEDACASVEEYINLHHFYGYPISDGQKIIATISIAVCNGLSEMKFIELDRMIRFARQFYIMLFNFQRSDYLNRQLTSVFDATDMAFGLFSSDGHLIKANNSFNSLFKFCQSPHLFDPGFAKVLGIKKVELLKQGCEVSMDVSENVCGEIPLLSEYARGRIVPVKAIDQTSSFFIFILHSRKAELRILETVKENEKKYQRIFNHIQDVYFEIKLDGTILEISPSVYHYTQLKSSDLIGTNILALYVDPKRREDYVKEISSKGRVDNYDLDLKMADGKVFNTIVTATLFDKDTPQERVVGSIVDVTELKRKTKAIVDNEIKFRSLFDNAPIGFMICSIEGDIIEINPSFLNIFGHSYINTNKETNILKNPTSIGLGISDIVKSVVASGKPVFTESQFSCSDNTFHSFRIKISIIPDQSGSSKYILIIAEDITEIKAKEQELEATRERFLDIYNNTSDLIYTMDFEGNFTSVNPVAEKWLGYRFQDLKNRNMSEFISHDSSKRAEEQIHLKLANASNHSTYEVTAYTRTKEKMILEINSFLRYKDGKPIEVFGIARDITERKKHEEIISMALREREKLIMEVHHRVKNNLQLVLSIIKMYMAPYQEQKIRRTFKNIIQKIHAIATAHEDFYFSIDFKEIEIEKYLNTVITTAIEHFDYEGKVSFRVEADKMMGSIDDVVPIGLIVSELISNSFQYGINSQNRVNVYVSFCLEKGKRVLTFKDDGPGIPAEQIRNIDNTMGLSLVKLLAENQLNGNCVFDSETGGTKVIITF